MIRGGPSYNSSDEQESSMERYRVPRIPLQRGLFPLNPEPACRVHTEGDAHLINERRESHPSGYNASRKRHLAAVRAQRRCTLNQC